MAKRIDARAQILAMLERGPVVPSEAAAEIGCSPSYARRILRECEAQGVQARPVAAPYGASASERVRLALADLGGEATTAAELARAASCSVAWARKVLASMAREAPLASDSRVAESSEAGMFQAKRWRVSSVGMRALEAERASREASRLEAECEASFTRRALADALAFDLF